MKKGEDIFNIFREGQEKLEEMPSARAWNRLEKKLDARAKSQRKVFYFQALAAASLALILAMVTALSVFDRSGDSVVLVEEDMHNSEMTLTATADDEIGVRDYREPLIMTHQEQKQFEEQDQKYHQLANNQIAESKLDPDKKLKFKFVGETDENSDTPTDKLAQMVTKDLPESKTKLSVSEPGNIVSDTKLRTRTGTAKENPKAAEKAGVNAINEITIADETSGQARQPVSEGPPGSDFSFEEIEPVEKPIISKDDVETIARKDLPEIKNDDRQNWNDEDQSGFISHAENLEKERAASLIDARKEERVVQSSKKAETSKKEKSSNKARLKGASIAKKSEPSDNDNKVMEERKEMAAPPSAPSNTIDIDASMNAITYDAIEDNTSHDIRLFEWLIGEWVDDDGESAEIWTRQDELTIAGKGQFIVNGEVTFTESMKITKINNALYFIVAVDSSNTEHYYRLSRYDGQEAVFENSSLDFPNQVIIQRNSDNNFSTIMQNSAPAQITNPQQGYLQNRNQITNERAFRNLKRAND